MVSMMLVDMGDESFGEGQGEKLGERLGKRLMERWIKGT
jgi:hypothetical protein